MINIQKIYLQKIKQTSFSLQDQSADFYMGKFILDNYFKKIENIIKNISNDLNGDFNKQNILISYICNKLLRLNKIFSKGNWKFRGLPFGSTILFENKKLKIINNSKSTNINSTINSIRNFKRIHLILGGVAKEKILNFTWLQR